MYVAKAVGLILRTDILWGLQKLGIILESSKFKIIKKVSLKKLFSVHLSKILKKKSVRISTTRLTITHTYRTYLGKQEFEKNRGLRLPISHSVLVYPYQHTKQVLKRQQDLILQISTTFLTQRDYLKHVWTDTNFRIIIFICKYQFVLYLRLIRIQIIKYALV